MCLLLTTGCHEKIRRAVVLSKLMWSKTCVLFVYVWYRVPALNKVNVNPVAKYNFAHGWFDLGNLRELFSHPVIGHDFIGDIYLGQPIEMGDTIENLPYRSKIKRRIYYSYQTVSTVQK